MLSSGRDFRRRKKVKNKALCLLFTSLIGGCGFARGDVILDQQQLIEDGATSARNLPGYSFWQSFTAGASGTLTEIDMAFFNNMFGSGQLEIFAGQGTGGPLLQSLTVPVVSTEPGFTWNAWSVNVPVQAGAEYTFSFTPDAATLPDPYGVSHGNNRYPRGVGSLVDPSGVYNIGDLVFRTFLAGAPSAPTITTQPVSRTVFLEGRATFMAAATGNTLRCQWRRDGIDIEHATNAVYNIYSARVSDQGDYTVVVSNSLGSVTSAPAKLSVVISPATISTPPASQVVEINQRARFSVAANGSAITYQWFKDGVAISKATNSLYLIDSARLSDAGDDTVVVANSVSSVTSAPPAHLWFTQQVSFTAPAGDFIPLNKPISLVATSTSGLPVTFTVQSGPAVIANGAITVTAPGTVWVTAEQAGDKTFSFASTTRIFNLRQAAVSVVGENTDSTGIFDFAVSGHFLYAASGEQGVRVFDMTDPALPKLVGQYPGPADSRKIDARKISVVGGRAYVASNFEQGIFLLSSFDVLDLTDPTKPALLGSLGIDPFPRALEVAGNVAYLLSGSRLIIDVSNPAALKMVTWDAPAEIVNSFQVVGSLLYSAGTSGLSIFDISVPTDPVEIAHYFDGSDTKTVHVSGGFVYALVESELLILRGDPTSLAFIGSANYRALATGLDVWGDYIFVAEPAFHQPEFDDQRPGGVVVFDASNPAMPLEVGGYRNGDSVLKIQVFNDIAYVAGTGSAQLRVLKTTLRQPPEPRVTLTRRTSNQSILSAPSIPGWQVEGTYSLKLDQVVWQDITWFDAHSFLEESDGIKRFRVGNVGETLFLRMRKADF